VTLRRSAPTTVAVVAAVAGLAAGLATAARTVPGDLLLNWDQVIGPTIPVPPGQYGTGLELPRRVPFYTLLAPPSHLIPGPAVVGLVLVAAITAAVVGMYRLAARVVGRAGAAVAPPDPAAVSLVALVLGLVYGLSPFLLTRAAVGHLPLVVAAAMMPWALADLIDRPWPRALGWAAGFALTGSSGAVVGLLPVGLAVLLSGRPLRSAGGRARWIRTAWRLVLVGMAQSVWVVPGLVALARGVPLPATDAEAFATRVDGPADLARLVVGGGFFVGSEDVAGSGNTPAAVLGLVLLVVVVLGGAVRRGRPGGHTRALGVLTASSLVGAVLVLAPVLPLVASVWDRATDWALFSPVREPHKFWPLPAAGLLVAVADVVGRPVRAVTRGVGTVLIAAVIGALTVVVAWPGLWGAGGRLVAEDRPTGWLAIEEALVSEEGPVIVFPWRRYDRLDLSNGRNVLQPLPWLLTDWDPNFVLTSGDPGLGPAAVERGEPLESRLAELDTEVRGGRSIGPALQALGVRWVVVVGSPDARFYRRLGEEVGVTERVEIGDYLLYEVGEGEDGPNARPLSADPARRRPWWAITLAVLAAGPTMAAAVAGFRSSQGDRPG